MNKTTARVLVAVLAIMALMLSLGCGQKPLTRKSESVLDTPKNHTDLGNRYLNEYRETGRQDKTLLEKAEGEFKDAKLLDPKFSSAYAGLGEVLAEQGKYEEAIKTLEKAKDLDPKNVDAYIGLGYVYSLQLAKGWEDKAISQFDRAIALDAKNSKAHYYKGVTMKRAYKFDKAAEAFKKVIELDKEFVSQANKEWELIQKIERAAPGTEIGMKIALIEAIDRADVAALFINELKIDKLMQKKGPKEFDTSFKAPGDTREFKAETVVKAKQATDIEKHWARNWIEIAMDTPIRGLQPFPDHTFQPDVLITRANYAQMIEDLLLAVGAITEADTTKFIGEESHFPDVRSDHFAYNSINTCVSRGIMKAEMDGAFGIDKHISGADALLIIREIKNYLKIS